MSFLQPIVDWTKDFFMQYGALGLFSLAFIESSFFPVPPDALLIPLVIASPESAMLFAFMTTIGSVLGAIFGYGIGRHGGRPILEYFVSEKNIKRVDRYYERYGIMAVGIAGFTPIPYKVFTISSGAFKMNLLGFVGVSVVSRGARFFLEAWIFSGAGGAFIRNNFGPVTVAVAIIVFAAYFVWKEWL